MNSYHEFVSAHRVSDSYQGIASAMPPPPQQQAPLGGAAPWLPWDSDLGNLAGFSLLPHTRFTYHRTWETGLDTEIRVAVISPAFFLSFPPLTHLHQSRKPPPRIYIY